MFTSRDVLDARVLLRDGSRALTSDWDIGGRRLRGALDPTLPQDYATKAYVDLMAGGGLPAGANGAVLGYAAGAWVATGVGTSGQVLTSNGVGIPTWNTITAASIGAIPEAVHDTGDLLVGDGVSAWAVVPPGTARTPFVSAGPLAEPQYSADVVPLTQRVLDASASAVSVAGTFTHDLSVVGAAGVGARALFRSRNANAAPTIVDATGLDGILTDATNGAEVGAFDIRVRSSGTLSRIIRFSPASMRLDWAARAILLRNSLDNTDIDIWRVDGGGRWVFGSDDVTYSGGTWLQAPLGAVLALRCGANTHVAIDVTGAITVGTTSHATTLTGTAVVITASTSLTVNGAPTVIAEDAVTAATSTVMTLRHTTSGAAAVGFGTRILIEGEDAAGNTESQTAIDSTWTNAGNGTEASQLDFYTRTGGAALARVFRMYPSGGVGVGNSGTNNDPGNGGICLPVTNGIYVSSGGTNYTCAGVFGGSTMIFGSGAYNVQINAYSLSISAGQGMGLNNGWFTIAAAAGFRTPPTVVTDTNHVVTANMHVIEVKGLTAARTETLPAHVSGTRVIIFCSDGSCGVVNKITVTPASGNINGAASFDLTSAYAAIEVISNGTSWTILHTR